MTKRVKRPHGLLPKVPGKGEKVVVVVLGGVVRAVVRRATGGRKIELRLRGLISVEVQELMKNLPRGSTVYRNAEGLTWARGWDTPAASALIVAEALRASL